MNLSTRNKHEVDLRVSQELKNNEQFIYQTNQSIQNLSTSIISLSLQNEKLMNKFVADKKMLEIDFENHRNRCENMLGGFSQRCSVFEKNITDLVDHIQFNMEQFRTFYVSQTIVDERFKSISDWIFSFEESYKKLCGLLNSTAHVLKGQIQEEVSNIRRDLTPVIPEVDPVKKHVDDVLSIFRVDFDGLIKEIDRLKKDVAYDQKKFENIYTLIERLKAGKNVPSG